MTDGIMVSIGADGVARMYDDTYDITIHCESEEEHDEVLKILQSYRKGKWLDYQDEGFVECPFCGSATNCDGDKDGLHYCFSCGAELS